MILSNPDAPARPIEFGAWCVVREKRQTTAFLPLFIARGKLASPDLVTQRLIRLEVKLKILTLPGHEVGYHAAEDNLALGIKMRPIAVAQIIEGSFLLADGIDIVDTRDVEIKPLSSNGFSSSNCCGSLVLKVLVELASFEVAASQGRDEDLPHPH